MEYLTGEKITAEDAFDDVDVDPHEMATRITKIYLQMGLVDGVFHADPHPGNLAVTDTGQLLIYDFGMSERLPATTRDDITGLYRALVRRDVDGLVDALISLDALEPGVNRAEVGYVLELVIENLEGRSDITWQTIITELTTMLRDFPFRIPPDLVGFDHSFDQNIQHRFGGICGYASTDSGWVCAARGGCDDRESLFQ
jgi:predicted unusual protein kinase regulating ubiquinone biosynthesis (AarF/ABC1/UbiB family)